MAQNYTQQLRAEGGHDSLPREGKGMTGHTVGAGHTGGAGAQG